VIHVLDAHAVLWYLEDDPQLGPTTRKVIEDPDARLVIPTIALAEVLWGLRKKRVDSAVWSDLITALRADPRFALYPMTVEVVEATPNGLEMHDAMICATALLVAASTGDDVQILTRDQAIVDSGLVSTVW
jgi:PIN domain nuclease of toxin-antitoxin system